MASQRKKHHSSSDQTVHWNNFSAWILDASILASGDPFSLSLSVSYPSLEAISEAVAVIDLLSIIQNSYFDADLFLFNSSVLRAVKTFPAVYGKL